MKKTTKKSEFLEQLKKIPIVQVACEKVGLSRNTVYRWRKEDKEFLKAMAEAMAEGEALVNDMSESQLLTLIKEKNWQSISFWLRHHHSAYRNRIEVTTAAPQEELTPEQEALVREALRLAAVSVEEKTNNKNHEQSNTTSANDGNDA